MFERVLIAHVNRLDQRVRSSIWIKTDQVRSIAYISRAQTKSLNNIQWLLYFLKIIGLTVSKHSFVFEKLFYLLELELDLLKLVCLKKCLFLDFASKMSSRVPFLLF